MKNKVFFPAEIVAKIVKERDILNNHKSGLGDLMVNNIDVDFFHTESRGSEDHTAIISLFAWTDTEEGFEFWSNMFDLIIRELQNEHQI